MFLSNDKWYHAYIATTIVSIVPNILLIFIPVRLLKEKNFRGVNVTHVLLCFAAAGLLGDVFLHTIPHLLGAHDHEHDNGHSSVTDAHDHHLEQQQHHHHYHHEEEHEHHHHEESHADGHLAPNADTLDLFQSLALFGLERSLVIQLVIVWGFLIFFTAEKIAKGYFGDHDHSHSHGHKHKDEEGKTNVAVAYKSSSVFHSMIYNLKSTGWLNLFADSMHNFTDGIAIGAAFASQGHGLGFATFVSVVCHEIPHEIGDFTILVTNGLSKSEAIKAQFLTAVAAIAGTAVGLLAQRNKTAEELMLAFSCGGFLYISTVNILPQIVSEKSGALQTLLELGAFALGIGMMVLVALYE